VHGLTPEERAGRRDGKYKKMKAGELEAVRLGTGPKARLRITADELDRCLGVEMSH
jgi:hypothetical protein